jgi:hypothetical protein
MVITVCRRPIIATDTGECFRENPARTRRHPGHAPGCNAGFIRLEKTRGGGWRPWPKSMPEIAPSGHPTQLACGRGVVEKVHLQPLAYEDENSIVALQ